MKVLKIQNINSLLLLTFICFTSCKQNKINEEDIKIVMNLVIDYTNGHSNIIDNKIAVLRLKQYIEYNTEMNIKAGFEPLLVLEDFDYFDSQTKKAREEIKYWSKSNIDMKGDFIDVFNFSKGKKEFSKEWWVDFIEKYNSKRIKMYSYPVFNLRHDISYVTNLEFKAYYSEPIISSCILKKDTNGNWKLLSCDGLY